MLPFRKILFPVDFSQPCQSIIPYVNNMTRELSAALIAVHACGGSTEVGSDFRAPYPSEESLAIEDSRLREFAAASFRDLRVQCITARGEPLAVIHKVVQHEGADLIMIPTRGQPLLQRFLHGSVTASVLHDVTAAVWTGVPGNFVEYLPRISFESFVCGLGSGDEAEMILGIAATFADSVHARLSLVNVVETSEELVFSPYKQDLLDKAEDRLRKLKRIVGVDAPHAILDSPTPAGIKHEAIRRNADLLILGRGHAQDKVSRIWSQLYAIVRESPCPVLSLPIRKRTWVD